MDEDKWSKERVLQSEHMLREIVSCLLNKRDDTDALLSAQRVAAAMVAAAPDDAKSEVVKLIVATDIGAISYGIFASLGAAYFEHMLHKDDCEEQLLK